MRTPFGALMLVLSMIAVDYYFFSALRSISYNLGDRSRNFLYIGYWLLSVVAIVTFLLLAFSDAEFGGKRMRSYLFALIIGLFMAKLAGCTFFLLDDLRRLMTWVAGKFVFRNTEAENIADGNISRSAFLSWLGVGISSLIFGSLAFGFSNTYRYKVRKISLKFPNLPASFNGFKIVQISDVHAGSLLNHSSVSHGIDMINELGADTVLFTGDLVNNFAEEFSMLKDVFGRIKAPMGVFSVLGNHDYGDYALWPRSNGLTKAQNLQQLKDMQASIGWKLLMNEHVKLTKGNDSIALLGVENWGGRARFPKYGNLSEAYKGSEALPFKILMSHDPSHWDLQVTKDYKDIDLTLSGHTHGMQFGVEIPGFKWSPVQYVYKHWAGIYQYEKQKLYVNRGFGFIGYPGRVGILPEITLIELHNG